jgi:predicted short-subunit dehydrogenase-like oxidoreductase (DUF2520 family)
MIDFSYLSTMFKVVLLGGGNLAIHLAKAFQNSEGIDLVQVYNRNLKSISFLQPNIEITSTISALKPADIYIICLADSAIESISNLLNTNNSIVVHTSGGIDLDVLKKHNRRGVIYPLQSFTKDLPLNFSYVPLCIEANSRQDEDLLKLLGLKISNQCLVISSEQRQKLHLAAVLVNNFVNHLYYLAESICIANELPFELLRPLIEETVSKLEKVSPFDAQSGPAKRNDGLTIENHLALLDEDQKKIYQSLTQSILKTYGN